MTMIIRLSDEQATALEVKAAAQGLSVELSSGFKNSRNPTTNRRVKIAQVPTSSTPCKPLLTATSTFAEAVLRK
jgi:hypothetical protein